jgi:hypothetical protein
MSIELSCGEAGVMFNDLEGCELSSVFFCGAGIRGDRREGVNVGALLMRGDFLGGIVNET